ncbi:hypothetical protein QFZ65_001846 [Arthrobacter sp. B3I9]|uniref:MafI family immunity protein n=1 Tax=Arthrobacter sp. B3I9 TaxID=3042270 RepID=UPI00278EA86E|nr:MafI family immunity protein [Arthrobacter sp. B3I9]MDQ0849908.1 hypothetical protein [Arthrobacter sp. B3I9]
MKISNLRDVEHALRWSLAAVQDDLRPEDVSNVRDFLDAGEPGLALDTLCTQLYEFGITVNAAIRDTLEAVGKHMGMDATLWTDLKVFNGEEGDT